MVRPDPSRIPAIVCKELSKSFGRVRALDRLSLLVPKGVTFGLLGPNGAGKTTSIRIWIGLTAADAGTAYVLGKRVPPRAVLPRIGYMPQEAAVYGDLTVEENLSLFGRLVGMDEGSIDRRADDVLKLVELDARRDDLVSTLSGGMKRRTSLAIAFLHDPDLLLLDEPTVGVDPELRDVFWRFFATLTSRGKTVLITTHYMEEAARCNEVALLHHGLLLAHGPPDRIKDRTHTGNLDDAFLALVRGSGVGPS